MFLKRMNWEAVFPVEIALAKAEADRFLPSIDERQVLKTDERLLANGD